MMSILKTRLGILPQLVDIRPKRHRISLWSCSRSVGQEPALEWSISLEHQRRHCFAHGMTWLQWEYQPHWRFCVGRPYLASYGSFPKTDSMAWVASPKTPPTWAMRSFFSLHPIASVAGSRGDAQVLSREGVHWDTGMEPMCRICIMHGICTLYMYMSVSVSM